MKINLKLVLIFVLVVILLGVALLFAFQFISAKETFTIEILNSTSEAIGDLKITYEKIERDIVISGIPSKASVKLIFKPQGKLGENALWLKYQDKNGAIHKEAIFGYFGKGYRGKAFIKIIKVEPNGIIKFEIKSDVKA